MKFILATLVALPLFVFAEEPCEVEQGLSQIENLSSSIAIPNCYTKSKANFARIGRTDSLCHDCREEFLKKYPGEKSLWPSAEIQAKKKNSYVNVALDEYKKVLTNNLVDVAKLRALRPTTASFEQSQKSCQFKQVPDFKNCAPEIKAELTRSLPSLQRSLANELANILTTEQIPNRSNGLLDRRKSPACHIPERDLLYLSNSQLEIEFTQETLDLIASLESEQFDTFNNLSERLKEKSPRIADLLLGISSHPLLSRFRNNPKDFISFIRSINPKNSIALQEQLYSDKNMSAFDKQLARSCDDAFINLEKAICGNDFNSNNFKFNPFKILSRLDDSITTDGSEFANSEALIENNLKVFNYCGFVQNDGAVDGILYIQDISQHLDFELRERSLKDYKINKYVQDFSSLNDSLCGIQAQGGRCAPQELSCSMYNRWQDMLKNKESLDSKLANSSNSNVNTLLRSMLGDPKDLDPNTKQILVLQGILPQSDGTMVAQADIPERQPGYFSKPSINSAPAPVQKTTLASQPARASRNSQNSSTRQELYNPGAYYENHLASQMPDFSDLLDESDKNLRNVQDEIMRRLSGLPNQRPTSSAQAKQIARDSLKSKGISNSSLESALASRMMATSPSATSNSIPTGSADMFDGERKEVASTSTETAAEKYKKDGMNRALADMYGARQSAGGAGASAEASANGRSPASGQGDAESEKPLSTVALSVPADPRVSLHQVFAEKLNKNDPEAQMLKVLVTSRKNFILQIGQVNFRVVFDKASQMNILLDSGDKDEAQRIRPQLEIFINRLRSI